MTNCKYCGGKIEANYTCMADGECFTCWHWRTNDEADKKDPERAVIVNGNHYAIGDETASKFFRGFAGQRFIIEFNDGRIVESTNLWHQGKISPYWKEKMPDNAKFVH